jgi:very-short-patch-repair endonuclease
MSHFKIPSYIFELCRKLRKKQTKAEELLWGCLRSKRLNGLKFRRQHPLGRYIADFYCPEVRLVIELNCDVHNLKDQKEYDEIRKDIIEVRGIWVLRIKNGGIERNIEDVLKRISSLTSPLVPLSTSVERGI